VCLLVRKLFLVSFIIRHKRYRETNCVIRIHVGRHIKQMQCDLEFGLRTNQEC